MVRVRAMLRGMTKTYSLTGTPFITSREIADRLGILTASVRTQMRAMRLRKRNPVDMRVPVGQRPADTPLHLTLYWRDDVEAWLDARARKETSK